MKDEYAIKQADGLGDHAGFRLAPDVRPVFLLYLLPLFYLAIVLTVYFLPIDKAIKFGLACGIFPVVFYGLYAIADYHVRCKTSKYVISTDHIEAMMRTRLFNQVSRRIPLAYVRDVTAHQSFFQSFFGVSNITVATTNGDTIILENLKDAHQTEAAIWELVLAHSPAAAKDVRVNERGG